MGPMANCVASVGSRRRMNATRSTSASDTQPLVGFGWPVGRCTSCDGGRSPRRTASRRARRPTPDRGWRRSPRRGSTRRRIAAATRRRARAVRGVDEMVVARCAGRRAPAVLVAHGPVRHVAANAWVGRVAEHGERLAVPSGDLAEREHTGRRGVVARAAVGEHSGALRSETGGDRVGLASPHPVAAHEQRRTRCRSSRRTPTWRARRTGARPGAARRGRPRSRGRTMRSAARARRDGPSRWVGLRRRSVRRRLREQGSPR